MSSSSSSSGFRDLAPEVVQQVTRHMQNDSLKTLRLVDKTLDAHAQRELFRRVVLSPGEEAIQKWNSVTQHDRVSMLPRHAIIESRAVMNPFSRDWDDDETDLTDEEEFVDFKQAINALSKLPNVNSLQVSFTSACMGLEHEADYWRDGDYESMSNRECLLKLVFEAIRSHSKGPNTIKVLTIENLQNASLDFADTPLFRSVIAQLDELHLGMTQECNEHGPDHDILCEELRTFPTHLVSQWLAPVAPHLKSLSLYARSENWGPFPGRYDFSSLSFPKLETLSLGYYTIAHDDQMDWILAQKSLTKLVFHNTMIAPAMRFFDDMNWTLDTRDWKEVPSSEDQIGQCFLYGGRWSQFFDRIADELPNLKEFRFDQGYPWANRFDYSVSNRHFAGTRLHPQRYCVFDMGILPTHWPEANDKGETDGFYDEESMKKNWHNDYLEEDQQSLDRLLEKCKERANKQQ